MKKFMILIISFLLFSFSVQTSHAVLSKSVTVRVGNPAGGGSGGDGGELLNELKAACGNIINLSDYPCVYDAQPSLPQIVISKIVDSVTKVEGGVLQCVGFVQAVAANLGEAFSFSTDAQLYAGNPPDGYNYFRNGSTDMQAGDFPVWDFCCHGHIAYTIQVYDDGSFDVANSNYEAKGKLSVDNFKLNDRHLLGWLRRK